MKSALVVVDMVRDTLDGEQDYPITRPARAIVPAINELSAWARARGMPVVFACDSFLPEDFIFAGRLRPHALRGSAGCRPSRLLQLEKIDTILPKRRFSAFFKTDLDQSLRTWNVEQVLLCGISTHFCVLATAFDALSHDFRVVLIEDACAAPTRQLHQAVVDAHRRGPLYPLLQVCTRQQVMEGN